VKVNYTEFQEDWTNILGDRKVTVEF